MATYESNIRWAEKTGRRQISLYLHEDTIERIDSVVDRLQRENPVTGGKRKPGRAEAIASLVDGEQSVWAELVDSTLGTCATWENLHADSKERNEGLTGEVEELSVKLSRADQHADKLQGEVDALKAQLAEAERTIRQKDVLIESQNRRILELEQTA